MEKEEEPPKVADERKEIEEEIIEKRTRNAPSLMPWVEKLSVL